MHEFEMPSLGASMEWGRLVTWNVEEGDRVERGQVICEVETEKGNIDVEIWESGVIDKLLVEPGTKVPVGEVLALVDVGEEEEPVREPQRSGASAPAEPSPVQPPGLPGGDASQSGTERPISEPIAGLESADGRRIKASPAARRRAAELGVDLAHVEPGPDGAVDLADVERAAEGGEPGEVAEPEHHVRVSPVARRLADELGVDLATLEGTGDHGAIVKADVERAAAAGEQTPAQKASADDGGEQQREAMRRAIAAAMERSKREIPHYYLEHTVDVSAALDWLEARNAEVAPPERVLPVVLFARALAVAATEFPPINGHYVDGEFQPSQPVHVGMIVSMRGGGVVAPAIHDVAEKPIREVMSDLRDVVKRARRGKLRASEMTDPTITLTNLGDQGVEKVWGVIYPPQVAIVGVGKVLERPWARGGMLGVRRTATFTLAADHRVSDGIIGAQFLSRIDELLQAPEEL